MASYTRDNSQGSHHSNGSGLNGATTGLGSFIYQPLSKQMKKTNMTSRQGGSQGSLNGGNRNNFSIKALNSVQNQNCSASANMSMIVGDANITAPNKKVMPHPMLRPKGIISGLNMSKN
eukprot:CAMPEP_0176387162 /NCGR_PEP_ID=MMETSP0126-20121128/36537_1 /TAXON_ID=141414 ORGANISM="Strombidinopsis acuminatum, Strain SPMC142" /NCGR_SAMPLE_ID=MMETSP0126 /ASSEMBLY_ACC=CAM_ASM_000229 /LENGTH=118 /DNA_ID=CAMNT_0017754573 /DNA_START=2279 /DNA_END=2635 /DNA_ORIENTATION=+